MNCTKLDKESDSHKENSNPFRIGPNPSMRQLEKHPKKVQDASADKYGFNLAPSSHGARKARFGVEEQEVSVLD